MNSLNNETDDEQYIREMRAVSVTDHLTDCIPYHRQEYLCTDCSNVKMPANMLDAIAAFCTGDVRCKKGQCTQTDDTACPYCNGAMLPPQAQR